MSVQINGSGTLTGVYNFPLGQCRFVATNGTTCSLNTYNGNQLYINGRNETVPNPSIMLSVSGLTPTTLYYVYAYMNSGVMTLEASTTTHQTDPLSGIEIKLGDITRTLVGMVRPVTGPNFQDNPTQRFVATYYNRFNRICIASIPTSTTTTSTTPVTINGLQDCEFLSWGDDPVAVTYTFQVGATTANVVTATAFAIDSHSTPTSNPAWYQTYTASAVGTNSSSYYLPTTGFLTEGYHYSCILWYVQSASGTITAFTGGYHTASMRI
jgi:hypothetical protein